MDWLVKSLRDFCLTQGFNHTYWIAYSGGLDSHVLLHLLAQLRVDFPLRLQAVHVHHGLSVNADAWAKHCAAVCQKLTLPLTDFSINGFAKSGESPEETARDRRYSVLATLLLPDDILLTAHHQDDQAETVLLQLLRGAGPKGLAAMPGIKPFAKGYHARPLLSFTRADLRRYALYHQLEWIDDESNENVGFARNFLRHEILPILQQRWPSVAKTISRVAENCAEAQQLVDEVTQQDLQIALGATPYLLSIPTCREWNPVRQRYVLRAWLNHIHFPVPSFVKLKQIQQDMLQARGDKSPYFSWHGFELRRYQDYLYAMPALPSHNRMQEFVWDTSQPLVLPTIGILSAKNSNKIFKVRFRQGGEKIYLSERGGHHSLKKLFQEWQVPPWQRDRVPLVFEGEKLIAVVGFFATDEEIFITYYTNNFLKKNVSRIK